MFLKLQKIMLGEIIVKKDPNSKDHPIDIWNGDTIVMSLSEEEAQVVANGINRIMDDKTAYI